MKNIMTILGAIIFASLIMVSCGKNSSKQKELELKERELALKEREFALKEKGISNFDSTKKEIQSTSKEVINKNKPTSETEIQKTNYGREDFLGCWYWGDEKEGFAILTVKPNGVLIIHRIDLNQDQTAGYKINGTKIVFTKQNLLMQNNYHIEKIKNKLFLIEEYSNPNKFKKIDCGSEQNKSLSFSDNICGLWKAKGKLNDSSGEIDVNFIKITNNSNGKLKFKKGYYSIPNNSKDTKSEKNIIWENDNDVYPIVSNNKLEGNFRVWQGSAPDAYYDTKFSIVLNDSKSIHYKSTVKDGSGNISNEQFEAIKTR